MLTVLTLSVSSVAISDTVLPPPIIRSTWYSRSDSRSWGAILAIGVKPERNTFEHFGPEVLSAARQLGDGRDQLGVGRVFREVSGRARGNRAARELIRGVHAEDQDGKARTELAHALQHVEAAAVRQRQIEDHHAPRVGVEQATASRPQPTSWMTAPANASARMSRSPRRTIGWSSTSMTRSDAGRMVAASVSRAGESKRSVVVIRVAPGRNYREPSDPGSAILDPGLMRTHSAAASTARACRDPAGS